MKRLLALTACALAAAGWLAACGRPTVTVNVNYSPKTFQPGDMVTFDVKLTNVTTQTITPRPKVVSFTLDGVALFTDTPDAPPYTTSLAPSQSVSKSFQFKLGCQNKVLITESAVGATWNGVLDAQPCADFHQACVDRINMLRKLENLPPLKRDVNHEGCSDQDAQTNYEKNTPHASVCGQAQNECGLASSVGHILNTCIQQQMYYDEKACYGKNPGGCYYDTACMCGHYVNITDKQNHGYTQVACGLYETPSGQIKSVQNFFK